MSDGSIIVRPKVKSVLISILIAISFVSTDLSSKIDGLQYLKYLPLGIALLFLGYSKGKILKISRVRLEYCIPFALIVISSLLRPFQYNEFVFYSSLFIISGFFFWLIPFEFVIKLKLINVSLFLGFFIAIITQDVNLDFSFGALIRSETSSLESNMLPFLFGLFTIFWLIEKNNKWTIVNLIFVILSFKRIVFLGVLACFITYFLPQKIKKILFKPYLFVIVNLLFVGITYYISTEHFFDLTRELLGISAGHFTAGRSTFVRLVFPTIENNPLSLIIGNGQDYLKILLTEKLGYFQHFHNDIFKLLIEHGVVVFMFFFWFLYKIPKELILLSIFFNICMATDNVLIYTPVVFCFAMLCYVYIGKHRLINECER